MCFMGTVKRGLEEHAGSTGNYISKVQEEISAFLHLNRG